MGFLLAIAPWFHVPMMGGLITADEHGFPDVYSVLICIRLRLISGKTTNDVLARVSGKSGDE